MMNEVTMINELFLCTTGQAIDAIVLANPF